MNIQDRRNSMKKVTAIRVRMRLAAVILGLVVGSPFALADCVDPPNPNVDWEGCLKEQLMLDGRDLTGSNFMSAKLNGGDFQSAELSDANFQLSELVRASFREADLSNANFEKALSSRADFSAANLSGARLVKVEFLRVSFAGSDLSGANMHEGNFVRNDFTGANLAGASLEGAIAPRALFYDANLAGTSFKRTFLYYRRFEGADLRKVEGMTQEQLDQACGDEQTKLPPGLTVPARWPCAED